MCSDFLLIQKEALAIMKCLFSCKTCCFVSAACGLWCSGDITAHPWDCVYRAGGIFPLHVWLLGARHSDWALHDFRSNLKRNKESGLSWCFGNTGTQSDTNMCSGFLWGQELQVRFPQYYWSISLVGVQGVEHFFPSFGDAWLTLVKIVCSDELNWSQQSWARCNFACCPTSSISFRFL